LGCRFTGSDHIVILVSAVLGLSFASFRRFWAITASVNSSLTPQGPRSRSRPRPRMRLRWAKSISTFLRLAWALGLKGDLAASRAKSRASSCSSRPMKRVFVFGQHFGFDGHASHIALVARYLRRPVLGSFLWGQNSFGGTAIGTGLQGRYSGHCFRPTQSLNERMCHPCAPTCRSEG
jgi:hypothetical protein